MYKKYYKRFLSEHAGKMHFACHSHHFWPDVTRQGMLDYWDHSAHLADDKWDYFFNEKIPAVKQLIATELSLADPDSLVFAANTHELLYRLISTFYPKKPIKVLCSDSEFHSFNRQSRRLQEVGMLERRLIPCEPFDTFEQRFVEEAFEGDYDLIFCSHVFFDSGRALKDINHFIAQLQALKSTILIDGYHAFMALPVDLSQLEDRLFYLAGSYKYAQGGEGACFMHVPAGNQLQPVNTGWFADFEHLEDSVSSEIQFSSKAQAFAGATMDFSALYRLEASLILFQSLGLNAEKIHSYVQDLQRAFLEEIDRQPNQWINRTTLIEPGKVHGHFFAFKQSSPEVASSLQKSLKECAVLTDCRGATIRFGFALYHNATDYDLSCLTSLTLTESVEE